MIGRLFLAVPRGCLRFVIVVFPDHTHLLFFVLFTVHVVENVQITSKLSPQNHFITKHILFLKQFHQLS